MRVVHPGTHKVYVLVTAETFDRLRPLLEEDFEVRETYAAQDAALAKVWDDPELDAYADYDRHRPQPSITPPGSVPVSAGRTVP